MNLSHNAQAITSEGSLGRQLILSCFLIAGAGTLLLWVSGGMPPTTWILLFQIGQNLTTQGSVLLLPFVILIIQSLLLATAWGLLAWIAIREAVRLMALRAEMQTNPSLSAPGETTTSEVAQVPLDSSSQAGLEEPSFAALSQKDDELPNDVQLHTEQAHTLLDGEDGLSNPFEEEVLLALEQRSQKPPTKGSQQENAKAETPSFLDAAKAFHRQNPFAVKPEVLNLFQSESTSESSRKPSAQAEQEFEQLSQKIQQDQSFAQSISVEAEQEFEQLSQEVQQDQSFAQSISVEEAPEIEEEVFVFGNPFEGPLPDVFEYDMDLKHSIGAGGTGPPAREQDSKRPGVSISKQKQDEQSASVK